MENLNKLSPPAPYLDDCGMVDADLRIIKCGVSNFPQWVKDRYAKDTEGDDISKLAFFYSQYADAVVLNREHPHYDLYELLVTTYMGVDSLTREMIKSSAPGESLGHALDILDFILEERSKKCQILSVTS